MCRLIGSTLFRSALVRHRALPIVAEAARPPGGLDAASFPSPSLSRLCFRILSSTAFPLQGQKVCWLQPGEGQSETASDYKTEPGTYLKVRGWLVQMCVARASGSFLCTTALAMAPGIDPRTETFRFSAQKKYTGTKIIHCVVPVFHH